MRPVFGHLRVRDAILQFAIRLSCSRQSGYPCKDDKPSKSVIDDPHAPPIRVRRLITRRPIGLKARPDSPPQPRHYVGPCPNLSPKSLRSALRVETR